ncbi:MAG: AsnC family transcriptional regulator [Candidatus Bathyarchaeota archaeon]|nr:MAG: AsnC family transcriptional regulator [Candidatus Bathyarchaeota archaeon]
MPRKLDELDIKILHQLQQDGRISITELAERVDSSRPTVTNRLRQLQDERHVIIQGGLNMKTSGFKMACVGLEVRNEESRIQMEQFLRRCPRVLFIFRTPEKANIHIGVWGEEDQTINSTIESFRDLPDVDIIYSHYLGRPVHGDIAIRVTPVTEEKTPCGKTCSQCHRYRNGWCLGCPSTSDYQNPLLQ